MEFGGTYLFAADRHTVWEALNDTEVLKAAVPGCRRLDWVGDSRLEMELAVNLGPLKPVFTGDLALSDIVPAERYTLSGRGRGGLLGRVEGAADIVLADDEVAGTVLAFTARGGGSGQVMKLGQAVIGASAQGVIDRFFARIGTAMGVAVTPLPQARG